MVKCPSCGGETESIGGGNYRCVYCFKEFSESAAVKQQSVSVRPTATEGMNYEIPADIVKDFSAKHGIRL